jgi:16S rRNA processing protein RimM
MNREKTEKKNICIGKILAPHGVKGLVKISLYTDSPHQILTYGKIFNKSESKEFEIKIKSEQKDIFLAQINGITDRTQAESIKGTMLYISRADLPDPEEEDFYINDLINLNVVDENKNILGKVVNFYNFGSGDILEVNFTHNNKLKAYTFTKNNFPKIDTENGFIIMTAKD